MPAIPGGAKFRISPIKLSGKMRINFNQFIIQKNWSRINQQPITRAGQRVRLIMRRSIRRDTSKAQNPAKPGRAPKSRAPGHPFKRIFSVPDWAYTSVIVGHQGFGSRQTPMEIHEFGQYARKRVRVRRASGARSKRQRKAAARLYKQGRIKNRKKKAKFVEIGIKYPLRPFAGPALDKARSSLPALWRNSVNKSTVVSS